MIRELVSAAIGTMAFSLLFGVPKKYYMYCGGCIQQEVDRYIE